MDAEVSLLACIIRNGGLIKEISLPADYFTLKNRLIYEAMKRLDEKGDPIDLVSLRMELGDDLLSIGGTQTLTDISNSEGKEENIKTYEKYIAERYKVKKAKELASRLKESNDIEYISETAEEISNTLEKDEEEGTNLLDVLLEIEEEANQEREDITGVKTGFTDLDYLMDGLNEEELTIIGARPSMGKTALALAITTNIAKQGHLIDFFSLEMSAKSLLYRVICSIGRINSMKMKNPRKRFNEKDWNDYRMTQSIIEKWKDNLFIHDKSNVTVGDIRSTVRRTHKKYPGKRHVVFIDYLTLIQGSGRKERHLEIGEITRNLKRLARDLNVSIVVLAQLSRALEQRQDKRPMLSDLRDSGEIEQDADKILFIHRDDYYNQDEENNITEIIVAKNRNGAVGTAELYFRKETQQFISVAKTA